MDKVGFGEQLQEFNYQERRITTWLKNLKAKVREAIKNQRDSTEFKNAGLLEDKINIQSVLHRALLNGQPKIIEFVVEAATTGTKSIVDRNPIQNAVLLEQFESAYRCFDSRRDGFDLRYFSHFLIWYMVGSSRDDEIATDYVKNFPAYRRPYGLLDRMSLLILRSVPDLQSRMLKLLLESGAAAALPDFCRYHRRDTDASSFMQASLQLRERTKEVQRLLGGCNCRGANAKEFMTLPAFHGFLRHSRKLANLMAHREAQLDRLRDFLATEKSPCLKGAIHQLVLAFISPLFWFAEDNSHMLIDDAIGAQMVRLMVEAGCDPNDEDDSGISPLQMAVSYINYDVVKALLEAGADVKNITFDGGLFHCRTQCNLSIVKNLYDIVEILQHYGFRMNDFHQYQVMRFLVDPDYSPLGLVMPLEGLIYNSDENMRIYYNELVDVLSSKDITKLFSVMTQFKNIRKVLQIIEVNNWYLDARRKKLLQDCLSLIRNNPDMQAQFRCCSVASELLELQDPPVVSAKMSDGTEYGDFARYNYKRTVKLFHGCDWREMREFFEETGRFRPNRELSYSLFRSKLESYRIIKAHILKSLKNEYLRVGAEMFWRKNSSIHYIHQAVPEIRDKIESNLDDGDFLAMYRSTLPDENPNPEIKMFALPQIFTVDREWCIHLYPSDVVYTYLWFKTILKN